MPSKQANYYILTIPGHEFVPYLPPTVAWIRGQLERGGTTNYLHWQLVVYFQRKRTLAYVKSIFGDSAHVEVSRSHAANEYVWKDDTAVEG